MKYLLASIVIAAAAAVYGLFSHGVSSYYMTYAFMIPLLGGALPHLIAAMKKTENQAGADEAEVQTEGGALSELAILCSIKDAHLAVIVTLTTGSLLKGVLDIYGTTNRLLIAYPVMAVLILAAALTVFIKRREGPVRIFSKKI